MSFSLSIPAWTPDEVDLPELDADVEITAADVDEALRRPDHFGYSGDNEEMFETWALGPIIRTRDSDLVEQANAEALIRHLESDPTLGDDWYLTGAHHWAVGWVDHLSFQALDEDGSPTRIFRVLKDWFAHLAEYPVADEEILSRLELEAMDEEE